LQVLRLVLVASLAVACQQTPPLYAPDASSDLRAACALTEQRCTACHERDRVVYADKTPDEWRTTVERMRRLPGSSIAPSETDTILKCLVNRPPR
jgi:hypothetical protein